MRQKVCQHRHHATLEIPAELDHEDSSFGELSMSQAVTEHRQSAPASLDLAVMTVSDTRTLESDTSGADRHLDRSVVRFVHDITLATKIRTNPYSGFGPATANRGSRGIRQRSTTKSTEIHGKENPNQLPLSVLLTVKIFEVCADFLTPDGLGSCRKCRDFGAHRSLVQSCGCGLAALGPSRGQLPPVGWGRSVVTRL